MAQSERQYVATPDGGEPVAAGYALAPLRGFQD
jgi:hypothetical protein